MKLLKFKINDKKQGGRRASSIDEPTFENIK